MVIMQLNESNKRNQILEMPTLNLIQNYSLKRNYVIKLYFYKKIKQ